MEINYALSAELKKKYKHRIRQCYKNAFKILIKGEVDYYVLGYVLDTSDNTAVRHCWGVKDNKIVDSTFGNIKKYTENQVYYSAFEIHRSEMLEIMLNYKPNLFGYKSEQEKKVINTLTKMNVKICG